MKKSSELTDRELQQVIAEHEGWTEVILPTPTTWSIMDGLPPGSTDSDWREQVPHFPAEMNAAAAALYITQPGMWYRVRQGYTCDDEVGKTHRKPCTWNGIHYDTVGNAARANGVTPGGMSMRYSKGYTCAADMKFKPVKA